MAVRHSNEVNLLHWYIETYDLTADDQMLVCSSIGFDLTQKNLLAPLLVGAQVVFPDAGGYQPEAIVDAARGCTLLNCAPSALYGVLDAAPDYARNFADLRYVLLGGENIDRARLRRWLCDPSCRTTLVNMYGPTECTDIATAHTLTADDWTGTGPIPMGGPIANVQTYVLDGQQQPVPIGTPGELWIASPNARCTARVTLCVGATTAR